MLPRRRAHHMKGDSMSDTTPLSDKERAELEELRRERTRRAEATQAARERRELERLKAELG